MQPANYRPKRLGAGGAASNRTWLLHVLAPAGATSQIVVPSFSVILCCCLFCAAASIGSIAKGGCATAPGTCCRSCHACIAGVSSLAALATQHGSFDGEVPDMETFAGGRVEQRLQAALERVRIILDATKDPQAAGDVHHQPPGCLEFTLFEEARVPVALKGPDSTNTRRSIMQSSLVGVGM